MVPSERRGGRTDEALIAAALDGDDEALDALLRRHYDRIYAVCRRIAGNDHDGLDTAQDTLVTVARRLDRFDGRSAFSTWVYRVATNTCLDELRRRRRRPVPSSGDEEMADTLAVLPDSSAPVATAAADRLDVDRALSTLPVDYRAAVVLRDLCQLDYAEIAATLDIPPGTVRSRIARGRAALADELTVGESGAGESGAGESGAGESGAGPGNQTPRPRRPTTTDS